MITLSIMWTLCTKKNILKFGFFIHAENKTFWWNWVIRRKINPWYCKSLPPCDLFPGNHHTIQQFSYNHSETSVLPFVWNMHISKIMDSFIFNNRNFALTKTFCYRHIISYKTFNVSKFYDGLFTYKVFNVPNILLKIQSEWL